MPRWILSRNRSASRGRLLIFALTIVAYVAPGISIQQTAWAGAMDEIQVLARVDGDEITTVHLGEILAVQRRPEGGVSEIRNLTADGLLKRLIQNRLLVHEGYRIGADEMPEVRNQVWEFVRHRAMLALLDSVTVEVPDPDPAEFESRLVTENVMYRLAHLLVPDEAFARALLDSLRAGTPFAVLADRHSLDTAWAKAGGDLGWSKDENIIPEFRGIIEDLQDGEFGGPVATAQGWHLVSRLETRVESVGQSEAMASAMISAAKRDLVMKKVREYVASLKTKYGVVVHDSLVATLDYGSTDPKIKQLLHSSQEAVAVLPWRTLTVSGLSRKILFENFHGIEGKPDAPQIRDRAFDEWVTELLLRHEADELGFDDHPVLVANADRLKREKMREVVVNQVLDVEWTPTPDEAKDYWAKHPDVFTPKSRVRIDGVLLSNEDSAHEFFAKLETGASVRWLASRARGVVDPEPAAFASWFEPSELGLDPGEITVGRHIGPLAGDGTWAVATIAEVETPQQTPFDECLTRVVSMMRAEMKHKKITQALERLEAEARVEIVDGSHELIETRIDVWLGTSRTPK